MDLANMHQQHVGEGSQLRMFNNRLRVPVQEHELRLRRARLLHSRVLCSQPTCQPIQHHFCWNELLHRFAQSTLPPPRSVTDSLP